MNANLTARITATYVVNKTLHSEQSLNHYLAEFLPQTLINERSLAQELSFGTIRWYLQLKIYLTQLLNKPLKEQDNDIYALLLIGLYQLHHTKIAAYAIINETVNVCDVLHKSWAKKLVNAVLRGFIRNQTYLEGNDNVAHPAWLIKLLKKAYPDDWQNICHANNQYPPFNLRANLHKISRDDYLQILAKKDITAYRSKLVSSGITLPKPCAVTELPYFSDGFISVQDEAPQLAAFLLDAQNIKKPRILDACAAPGGKTCHLLETYPNAEITAADVSTKRLVRLKQNIQRLNISDIKFKLQAADLTNLNWWDNIKFDRILLDAPCSATGVIRRHPDIKIKRTSSDVKQLCEMQALMLDNLWQTLKKGGILLYATCSILPCENNMQIANFLTNHHDAKELPINLQTEYKQNHGLQLLPQNNADYHHDGFYYAKLLKV